MARLGLDSLPNITMNSARHTLIHFRQLPYDDCDSFPHKLLNIAISSSKYCCIVLRPLRIKCFHDHNGLASSLQIELS